HSECKGTPVDSDASNRVAASTRVHRGLDGCCCCCCLHIKNHPGLSIQYLFLSPSLRTHPTLDTAGFLRGHSLIYLKKVYGNETDPKGQQSDKIHKTLKTVRRTNFLLG
ncbi:unnamed protein product, partial [Ectocarpus sp. 8 AP-2014]